MLIQFIQIQGVPERRSWKSVKSIFRHLTLEQRFFSNPRIGFS